MRYDERLKNMWKACARDESRYALQAALVDPDKKVIVATDGHMLAVLDVSDLLEPEEKQFLIPVDAFKAAQSLFAAEKRKEKKLRRAIFIRSTDDAVTVTVGYSKRSQSFDKETRTYPQWEAVTCSTDGYEAEIVVSMSLLTALVDAMRGTYKIEDSVTIHFKKKDKATIVSVGAPRKSYGMLMPMRSEHTKPTQFWKEAK